MSKKTARTLSIMSQVLVDDENFIAEVQKHIEEIKEDGVVNLMDVPELVKIVVLAYNNIGRLHVSTEELPEFLTAVLQLVVNKFNLIPEDNIEQFQKLTEKVIALVLLVPSVNVAATKCLSCCNIC